MANTSVSYIKTSIKKALMLRLKKNSDVISNYNFEFAFFYPNYEINYFICPIALAGSHYNKINVRWSILSPI